MTREPIEVTRQDRIYCLKASSDYHSEVCEECRFYPKCDHMTQDDMTELTIKDLETLEQEPCTDVISRQTLDEIKELMTDINGDTVYAVRMSDLRQLPSITPQQKIGYWTRELIINEYGGCIGAKMICSECGQDNGYDKRMKFCPNCGAKMEVEE